jgi:hypothetical protein
MEELIQQNTQFFIDLLNDDEKLMDAFQLYVAQKENAELKAATANFKARLEKSDAKIASMTKEVQ